MLEYDRKAVGTFLKQARGQTGLTQAEVASQLGHASPQFVSNIERGASVAPLPMLHKMITMYEASPQKLVNLILNSQRELLRAKLNAYRKQAR